MVGVYDRGYMRACIMVDVVCFLWVLVWFLCLFAG